jgi:glycopeptide antibiotics resistance protein
MQKLIKIVLGVSFIFYLFILVVLLFLGYRGYVWADQTLIEYMKSSSNFVPFKTIGLYINAISSGSMNMDIPLKNLVGNLIMFLPMGVYLPYFMKKVNKVMIFSMSMILLLFVIEGIQVITRRGSFDIDDFILNMLGAWIGFGIWRVKGVQRLVKYDTSRQDSH